MEIKFGKHTFRLGKKIGKGNFSIVYEAELTNGCLKCRTYNKVECNKKNHNLYALKEVFPSAKNKKYLEREAKILSELDHENIVKLYGNYQDDKCLYLILEYIDGITLEDHLKKKVRLMEKEAFDIFSQVVNGVKYLHSKSTIHRDLKPENILLEKPDHKVKIIDMGLSKNVLIRDHMTKSVVGTPVCMPPDSKHAYTVKFDVWSLGCLLYKLLVGVYPFIGEDVMNYCKFPESEYLSEEANDLLKSIFQSETSRIDILDIEKTSFFTKYSSKRKNDSGFEYISSSSRSRNYSHGRSHPKDDSGYSHGGSIKTNESISDYNYSDLRHPYLSDRKHLTEQRQKSSRGRLQRTIETLPSEPQHRSNGTKSRSTEREFKQSLKAIPLKCKTKYNDLRDHRSEDSDSEQEESYKSERLLVSNKAHYRKEETPKTNRRVEDREQLRSTSSRERRQKSSSECSSTRNRPNSSGRHNKEQSSSRERRQKSNFEYSQGRSNNYSPEHISRKDRNRSLVERDRKQHSCSKDRLQKQSGKASSDLKRSKSSTSAVYDTSNRSREHSGSRGRYSSRSRTNPRPRSPSREKENYATDYSHSNRNINSQRATFRGRSSSPTQNHSSAERKPPSPINTLYFCLKPKTKKIKNLTLEIRHNGDILVSKPRKSIRISKDGMKIEVITSNEEFTLQNLPKKYWALYEAGKTLVNYEKDRERKVIHFGEKAAFTIFGNSDIEMKFYDGGVISRKNGDREVCYTDKDNSVYKEEWSKFKTDFDRNRHFIVVQKEKLRGVWEDFNEMLNQCVKTEKYVEENKLLFPAILGNMYAITKPNLDAG